jgi:hypothetical protein
MAMLSMKRASLSLIMGVLLVSGCLVLGAIKDAQAMGIKQVTSKKGINGWLIRDSMAVRPLTLLAEKACLKWCRACWMKGPVHIHHQIFRRALKTIQFPCGFLRGGIILAVP